MLFICCLHHLWWSLQAAEVVQRLVWHCFPLSLQECPFPCVCYTDLGEDCSITHDYGILTCSSGALCKSTVGMYIHALKLPSIIYIEKLKFNVVLNYKNLTCLPSIKNNSHHGYRTLSHACCWLLASRVHGIQSSSFQPYSRWYFICVTPPKYVMCLITFLTSRVVKSMTQISFCSAS